MTRSDLLAHSLVSFYQSRFHFKHFSSWCLQDMSFFSQAFSRSRVLMIEGAIVTWLYRKLWCFQNVHVAPVVPHWLNQNFVNFCWCSCVGRQHFAAYCITSKNAVCLKSFFSHLTYTTFCWQIGKLTIQTLLRGLKLINFNFSTCRTFMVTKLEGKCIQKAIISLGWEPTVT